MVLCKCRNNNEYIMDKCEQCSHKDVCNEKDPECYDDKTLGILTEIFITLTVINYVFLLLIIFFVVKIAEECKNKEKWIVTFLIVLILLLLCLGWVPYLGSILVFSSISIIMYYYLTCKKTKI